MIKIDVTQFLIKSNFGQFLIKIDFDFGQLLFFVFFFFVLNYTVSIFLLKLIFNNFAYYSLVILYWNWFLSIFNNGNNFFMKIDKTIIRIKWFMTFCKNLFLTIFYENSLLSIIFEICFGQFLMKIVFLTILDEN